MYPGVTLKSEMFKVCPECDFEWHINDGSKCPSCNQSKEIEFESETNQFRGGAFGTGENSTNFKNVYKAIGLITLLLIIYSLLRGWW